MDGYRTNKQKMSQTIKVTKQIYIKDKINS